jgi:intein/homing endonuclease
LFFEKLLDKGKFPSWNSLAKYLGTNRKILLSYRNGKLSFPENYYKKAILFLNKIDIKFFEKVITKIDDNWGRVKGGKRNYELNPAIYEKGRRKAIEVAKTRVVHFDINMDLNQDLAYFLGLFIGDGFTNKYQRYYLTQFVGHYPIELDYYKNIISKISISLFDLNPIIKKNENGNFIRVNFYSRDLFDLITKRFKIKAGAKSKSVLIPDEILKSERRIIVNFLAGLFDAEASMYYDKRPTYKKSYPIIEFHIFNEGLVKQISHLLYKFKIKHYIRDNFSRIYLYGEFNVKKFLKNIPIRNPKLLENLKN